MKTLIIFLLAIFLGISGCETRKEPHASLDNNYRIITDQHHNYEKAIIAWQQGTIEGDTILNTNISNLDLANVFCNDERSIKDLIVNKYNVFMQLHEKEIGIILVLNMDGQVSYFQPPMEFKEIVE